MLILMRYLLGICVLAFFVYCLLNWGMIFLHTGLLWFLDRRNRR